MEINTKTPLCYYGGKQNMLKEILPLIPDHKVYVEPFFGGGALYFAKQPSEIEIINDKNDFVINFYRVLKLRFDDLKKEVEASLSSRSIHRKANWIMKNAAQYDEVKLAWACWYILNYSFSAKIGGGWRYDSVQNKDCQVMINRKERFNYDLVRRLELTQIECNDAIKVMQSRDHRHSFFYIDPPYIDSDQGHYKGYTRPMFTELLQACEKMQGRFMLSHFPNDLIDDFAARNGWVIKSFDKCNYATRTPTDTGTTKKRKTEILVMNYTIESKQMTLI